MSSVIILFLIRFRIITTCWNCIGELLYYTNLYRFIIIIYIIVSTAMRLAVVAFYFNFRFSLSLSLSIFIHRLNLLKRRPHPPDVFIITNLRLHRFRHVYNIWIYNNNNNIFKAIRGVYNIYVGMNVRLTIFLIDRPPPRAHPSSYLSAGTAAVARFAPLHYYYYYYYYYSPQLYCALCACQLLLLLFVILISPRPYYTGSPHDVILLLLL